MSTVLNFLTRFAVPCCLAVGLIPGAAEAGEAGRAGEDSLAGVVRGPNGPEAGVWVIAETTGLPTKFVKIVVTDDEG